MNKTLFALVAIAGMSMPTAFAAGKHDGGHDEAAYGQAGDPAKVTRTIKVEMSDSMRFKPANINVKLGETVKFIATNTGKLKHEFVLGQAKSLKEHSDMMRKMPDMGHAEPNQIQVEPGQSGELVWQFTKAGKFDFACLIPGHFEAGMKGKVAVKK